MSISPNQWTILERLEKGPAWIRTFQTVKPLLDNLIEQGLIERCRPHLGAGSNQVRLTLAGCDKLEIDPTTVPTLVPLKRATARANSAWGEVCAEATGRVRSTCESFLRSIRSGDSPSTAVGQLAGTEGVNRPAIWQRLIRGGVKPSYNEGAPSGRKAAGIMRDREDRSDAPPPVDRDPCPRCGIRGDLECSHNRAPIGMIL